MKYISIPALIFVLLSMGFSLNAVVFTVKPLIETEPAYGTGDNADDVAIWIHPSDPNRSTVIGHSKDDNGGLHVYDLAGREIQFLQRGKIGNLDLRYHFSLAGKCVDMVCAVNRSEDTIEIYKVNPNTRHLETIAARTIPVGLEVYGACMYRSPRTHAFYFFINSKTGEVEQWKLFDNGAGKVDARLVRRFDVGDQVEGCVADDKYAQFYIGEEERGIWKYGAEPEDPTDENSRLLVDSTTNYDPNGHLVSNVEGLAIYHTSNGKGYLIASSQGEEHPSDPLAHTFALYHRTGTHAFIGSFAIKDNPELGIDGCRLTDGIEVTNAALGSPFPNGLFVAHDNDNEGAQASNYKFVSWETIAQAFQPTLTIDTSWNPRIVHGDLNQDQNVNMLDYAILTSSWMTVPGDPQWNSDSDLSLPQNNQIDIQDLNLLLMCWPKSMY